MGAFQLDVVVVARLRRLDARPDQNVATKRERSKKLPLLVVAANGECLAWFGSRGEGICMGYSSGNGLNVGTPDIGVFGPEYGNGIGIVTGPLLPGTTINEGISP